MSPQRRQNPSPQTRVSCPICSGNHHAIYCDLSLDIALNNLMPRCQTCGETTFGGPFCINCTIDRALARGLRNANQNR